MDLLLVPIVVAYTPIDVVTVVSSAANAALPFQFYKEPSFKTQNYLFTNGLVQFS